MRASFPNSMSIRAASFCAGACRMRCREMCWTWGCGLGAMTVLTLAAHPDVRMTMADVKERALALAEHNVQRNGMQARAVLSDGFEKIEGMFDAVITNPPIRAGKKVIYRIFEDAKAHLKPGGALYLVIRKQQGAPSALTFLRELYGQADVLERESGYWVIRCIQEAPVRRADLTGAKPIGR